MLYVDTSVLVASLTREAATDRVQRWLSEQNPEVLTTSDWVVTEFSSALSIKLRKEQLEAAHRADALAMLTRIVAESFSVTQVTRDHFRTAARFADQHALNIRAGEALHLAHHGR